jgi:prevent-host-death family protein
MKTANVAELKNRLSAYLQFVREGEEILVKDRNQPIARISPYKQTEQSDDERQLVASGALKMPAEETANWGEFWDEFFALPGAGLKQNAIIQAVVDEREEGW